MKSQLFQYVKKKKTNDDILFPYYFKRIGNIRNILRTFYDKP